MKKFLSVAIGIGVLAFVPLATSAQSLPTNSSISIQQSFLTELQSLQQELAALTATINAMIVAVGGTAPSNATTNLSTAATQMFTQPVVPTTLLPSLNLTGDALTSSLLSEITASTTLPLVLSTTTITTSTSIGTPTTQLDPSCVSGLFANGAQCGGLYYCGSGATGYWSSTLCSVTTSSH